MEETRRLQAPVKERPAYLIQVTGGWEVRQQTAAGLYEVIDYFDQRRDAVDEYPEAKEQAVPPVLPEFSVTVA